jgi:hypothetical protein
MPVVAAVTAVLSGFDVKLPSRGDFVGDGPPRSFRAPWQAWMEACLTASRLVPGNAWLDAVEPVALEALASDWPPANLADGLRVVPAPPHGADAVGWWTAGGALVPATRLLSGCLPPPGDFAAMILAGDTVETKA